MPRCSQSVLFISFVSLFRFALLLTPTVAVTVVEATATKWDTRDGVTDAGCGEVGGEGCVPGYTIVSIFLMRREKEMNEKTKRKCSCHA